MTNKMYQEFIENTIKTEGWAVADRANKIALETKKITQSQYREAAGKIAKAFLEA